MVEVKSDKKIAGEERALASHGAPRVMVFGLVLRRPGRDIMSRQQAEETKPVIFRRGVGGKKPLFFLHRHFCLTRSHNDQLWYLVLASYRRTEGFMLAFPGAERIKCPRWL